MPNTENIAAWVAALRSGDYRQAKGYLRREIDQGKVGYCCLGVACDISGAGQWDGAAGFSDADSDDDEPDFSNTELTSGVERWLGIDSDNPDLNFGDRGWINAATANDDYEFTFDQIADAIERTYLT